MTKLSKTKSHFKPVPSKIYASNLAKRLRTNNQQMCIDCLKPRSNKNERECKRCDCACFHVPIIKDFHLQYCSSRSFCNVQKWQYCENFDAVDYFEELPFYNKTIEKPKVKRLQNIDQLAELPFYEQLSIIKTNNAFRGYATFYKVEIIEKKGPIVQLEASKLSIKDLLNDVLNETKGFKYQITVKVLLKKYKLNGQIEFAPVYFN